MKDCRQKTENFHAEISRCRNGKISLFVYLFNLLSLHLFTLSKKKFRRRCIVLSFPAVPCRLVLSTCIVSSFYVVVLSLYALCVVLSTSVYCHTHFLSSCLCHSIVVICTLCRLFYVIVSLSYPLCVVFSKSLYCRHIHFASSSLRHYIVVICTLYRPVHVVELLSYVLCVVLSTSLYCCHMHFVLSYPSHCIVVICTVCRPV